jgi:GH25 family lysozyme M1 (1,4-beta-N-acetylmuramidase)
MGIYGQDWSSYQGTYPPAAGLAFVFIKVTEGMSYTNPYWQSQRGDALRAGAAVGFYHYPHMHNNAHNEADYFSVHAQIQPNEMIVLDWEGYDSNNAGLTNAEKLAYKESYLTYMKQKFPHNPVGLYCNTDYWYNVDTTGHAGDFLWIATGGLPAGQPGLKSPWKFHQYSANPVDKDYGNFASVTDLKNWIASFNGTTPTPPGDDMTPAESKMLSDLHALLVPFAGWNYSHGDLPDVHQTLTNAAADAAAAKAAVAALQADVTTLKATLGVVDPAKLEAALVTAVDAAIAKDVVTATVEVNGKVV